MSAAMNPMNQLRITKVCVNIGVGEGGERLVNAESVLVDVERGEVVPSLQVRCEKDRIRRFQPMLIDKLGRRQLWPYATEGDWIFQLEFQKRH